MPLQSQEQILHDRVNLRRLVQSVEKTVSSEEWQRGTQQRGKQVWTKVQGILHKVRYARKMLRNLELNDVANGPSSSSDHYQNLRTKLNDLESVLLETDKRVVPQRIRPEQLLPTLAIPEAPAPTLPTVLAITTDAGEAKSPGPGELSAQDLLLSPADALVDTQTGVPTQHDASVVPVTRPSSGPLAPISTGTILQNSRAIQEELSEQLAQMATQLKRNALHFSTSLENDKAIVLEAQEKLERNHDVMTKERIRLRDHHSKTWGTTWITILSIIVAVVGFFLTFFVIRLT